MKIRRATIDDLLRIQELNLMLFEKEHKEYDDLLNLDWTFSDIGSKYFTGKITEEKSVALIAEEQDFIVGYLVGGVCETYKYRNLESMTELQNMFVLDEYRGKGVGSALMKEFLEWSKQQGVPRVHVEASALNKEAIEFYRKSGFEDYTLDLELKLK